MKLNFNINKKATEIMNIHFHEEVISSHWLIFNTYFMKMLAFFM